MWPSHKIVSSTQRGPCLGCCSTLQLNATHQAYFGHLFRRDMISIIWSYNNRTCICNLPKSATANFQKYDTFIIQEMNTVTIKAFNSGGLSKNWNDDFWVLLYITLQIKVLLVLAWCSQYIVDLLQAGEWLSSKLLLWELLERLCSWDIRINLGVTHSLV